MNSKPPVALIGAGSMGGALLRGWLETNAIDCAHSAVFDPGANETAKALCDKHHVCLNPAPTSGQYDAVVIAVKPQIVNQVLPQYASIAKGAVVVSVMAGKSVDSVSKALDGAEKICRTMPNLPAAIGKGVTGLYAPSHIGAADRAIIETLMAAAGKTVWVETEQQIDFVTAISGSGPAYYFLLTEALAEAGAALGLSKEAASELALATLTGAGALMDVETRSPAQMRKAVTSPGGTTEAALKIFDGDDTALRKLVHEAVKAAARRGGELTD